MANPLTVFLPRHLGAGAANSLWNSSAEERGRAAAAAEVEVDDDALEVLDASAVACGGAVAAAPFDPTRPHSVDARIQARLDDVAAGLDEAERELCVARTARDDADALLAATDAPRGLWDAFAFVAWLGLAGVGGLVFEPTLALFVDARVAERIAGEGVPLPMIHLGLGIALSAVLAGGHIGAGRAGFRAWAVAGVAAVELAILGFAAWSRAALLQAEAATGNAVAALARVGAAGVSSVADAAAARTWLLFGMEALVIASSVGLGLTLARQAALRARRGELRARARGAAAEVARIEARRAELTTERKAIEAALEERERSCRAAERDIALVREAQRYGLYVQTRENHAASVGVRVGKGRLRLVGEGEGG